MLWSLAEDKQSRLSTTAAVAASRFPNTGPAVIPCRQADELAGQAHELFSYIPGLHFIRGYEPRLVAPPSNLPPLRCAKSMTKYCEECHTANRDRAQYCRGCAVRFPPASSPADQSAVSVSQAAGARDSTPTSVSKVIASSSPPVALVRGPGGLRPSPSLLGALLQTAAVLWAALVVWHQWAPTSDSPKPALHSANGESQQASWRASSTPAPGLAVAAPQAEPTPAPEEPSDAQLAATTAASLPASQESLLALTVERTEKTRQSTEGAPARNPRILNPDRPWAIAGDEATHYQGQPDGGTESDMGMSVAVATDQAATNRSAAVRRVKASPRPFHQSGTSPLRALAITGPCDRYNPWGEAICISTPSPQRFARASRRPGP